MWYYVGGANQWWLPASYSKTTSPSGNTTMPGAGDRIVLTSTYAPYSVDDTTIAFFSTVKEVWPRDSGVTTTFNLTTNAVLGCYFGDVGKWGMTGWLVKKGAGKLTFTKTGDYIDSGSYYYGNRVSIDIQGGSVQLEPSSGNVNHWYQHIRVAAGCTLYGVTQGTTLVASIAGAGLITNTVSTGTVLLIKSGASEPTEFSGVLAGFGRFNQFGCVNLSGTESTIASTFNPAGTDDGGQGITGFKTMGSPASSIGMATYIHCSGPHRFVYLGETDYTANLSMNIPNMTSTLPIAFDGGAQGGLTWSGTLTHQTSSAQQHLLELTGDNARPCVFSGRFAEAKGCSYRLTKSGSGTWRILENSASRLTGVVGVEAGALEGNTLRGKFHQSSFGLATNLYEKKSATYTSLAKVDYAHLLGGDGTEGTLSYLGTDSRVVTDRPIALAGDGRLVATNCPAIKWKGVKGLSAGEKTFTFVCGAGQTNMLSDVTDGAGTVSVVKEGAGDLVLTGDLPFGGDLVAKGGGTLTVRKTSGATYTWYRLTIQETAATTTNKAYAGLVNSTQQTVALNEFGLYDSTGARQNGGWYNNAAKGWHDTVTNDLATLGPQRVAAEYATDLTIVKVTHGWQAPWRICADANTSGMVTELYRSGVQARPDDPASWISFVVRLSDTANAVTAYDLNFFRPASGQKSGFSSQPTAWTIDGSADGLDWETVMTTNNVTFLPAAHYCWLSDGTVFSAKQTRKGIPLAHSTVQANNSFLGNVRSVSAVDGTTIKAEGGTMTVDGLSATVAGGLGKFVGLDFAASGTLYVTGVDFTKQTIKLGGDFTGSTGAANLAAYKLYIDGKRSRRYSLRYSATDGLVLVRQGFCLYLR